VRAVVAGATGFLGGYLLEALLASGVEPVALVRQGSDLHLINRLGVEKRFGDLLDLNSLNQALRGGEILFNAAGKVADWGSWKEFLDLNRGGTAHLLAAAIRNRVRRFVQVSSVSAYGMRFLDSRLLVEETPFRPSPVGRDFYCRSKYLAEQEVKSASREGGIEFVILRPGIILGERDSSVTRRISSLAQRQERVLNVGGLKEKIQLNHARDVARAVVLAGLHGPTNEIYNVSCPPEISKFEFWTRALKALHLQKEIREVSYPLGLAAGWMFEQAHRLWGKRGAPEITLWSVYLMGNRNLIDSSKIFSLGWRPQEDIARTVENSFRQYVYTPNG